MKEHLLYLRENGAPVACVAVRNNGADSAYQLSVLNPRDRFDKPLARKIATGRLGKKPIALDLSADTNFHNTARTVIEAIANNPNTPLRAKRAAEVYLENDDVFQTI